MAHKVRRKRGIGPRRSTAWPGDAPRRGTGPAREEQGAHGGVSELARIAPEALGAALEAIPSPAFVVRAPATILRANARGRALLDLERDRVLAALTTPEAGVVRRPLRFPIDPARFVAVFREIAADARERGVAIASRWRLTPRQGAVLELVAQGDSNRAVAGRLGCSEKTIELHVSALLAKTGCASRSQLAASFWTEYP
jgi:DNA-binding CsgD family transcriptional regulator